MKCPKCGFVSYAGLDQCKKCGYAFVKAAPKGPSSSLTTLFPEGVRAAAHAPVKPEPSPKESSLRSEPELPTEESARQPAPAEPIRQPQYSSSEDEPVAAHGDEPPADWREELSERVENFRKRRARLHGDAESAGNLELDFTPSVEPEQVRSSGVVLGSSGDRDPDLDMEIGESAAARGEDGPSRGTYSLEDLDNEKMQLDAIHDDTGEMALGEPAVRSVPMEIQVGSPAVVAPEEEAAGIFLAPLGRRFLAGLADALVLLLGAALFGTIFWFWCGYLTPSPVNIVVLGLAAVILIFAYFAAFTAIASATPGLLWMGCEIRNLEGNRPTVRESFWRAFGVLVSMSALMLGFIWACVDSDTLTWHDRMSGTVVAEEHVATDLAGLDIAP